MESIAKHFQVPESNKQAILAKYGKTKETIKEDVQILKEWLKKQPHIPEIQVGSDFLEILLVRNKCRIEKTKIKIDNYFTSKNVYADYFATLDPCSDAISRTNKTHHFGVIPKLTPNNERIIFWTMRLPSEDYFDQPSFMRYGSIMAETQMYFDYSDSTIFIFDMIALTLGMVLKYNINIFAKMILTFLNAFSGRVSSVHLVNQTTAMDALLKIAKPLMPAKISDRIVVHKKCETLFDYFPKECLPSEVGGTSISAVEGALELAKQFEDQRDLILKRNKNGTNESLRVGKPYIQVDMFGSEGTFKKINLD